MSGLRKESPAAIVEAELVAKLRSRYGSERLEAVQELRKVLGARAVQPLCEALGDEKLTVRTIAAMELGALGDARAVPALRQALRSTMSGGTAWKHVSKAVCETAIWLLVWIAVSMVLMRNNPTLLAGAASLAIAFLTLPWAYMGRRRIKGRFVVAVSVALARITERQVAPEVHGVSRELRILAADRLQQDAAARELIRKAAERIEAATERYRDLPLASAPAPMAGDVQLPRVADAPVEAVGLPVVRQED